MKLITKISFPVEIEGHSGTFDLDCRGIKLHSSARDHGQALMEMRGLLIDILRASEPALRAEMEAEER